MLALNTFVSADRCSQWLYSSNCFCCCCCWIAARPWLTPRWQRIRRSPDKQQTTPTKVHDRSATSSSSSSRPVSRRLSSRDRSRCMQVPLTVASSRPVSQHSTNARCLPHSAINLQIICSRLNHNQKLNIVILDLQSASTPLFSQNSSTYHR